jgi:hypothetical protein
MLPSSRFASGLKPNVAYLALNSNRRPNNDLSRAGFDFGSSVIVRPRHRKMNSAWDMMESTMSAVHWTDRQRIGFADIDQDRRIKFSSMIRFVGAGYAGLFSQLTPIDRADYFTTHGLTPITTYAQLERASRSTPLDTEIELRYGATLGFVRGRESDLRRYGGYDEIELSDAERAPVVSWSQHWLWFSQKRGTPLDRPAPGLEIDQTDELPPAPARPDASSGSAAEHRFRWALRETDINNHVTFAAYLERAENALADAQLNAASPDRVSVWFSRPSFAGELMHSVIADDDGAFVVQFLREQSGELCATLCLRAAVLEHAAGVSSEGPGD